MFSVSWIEMGLNVNLTLRPWLSEGFGTGAQWVDLLVKVDSVALDILWMVLMSEQVEVSCTFKIIPYQSSILVQVLKCSLVFWGIFSG